MQARVKQSSRYGRISAFSGMEFVKHEWRRVPTIHEKSARENEYLEIREGKAEKEVVEQQAAAAVKLTMKARLAESYKDSELRTMSGKLYVKNEWRDVPEGFEDSARRHELLQVWEAGQEEPAALKPHEEIAPEKQQAKPAGRRRNKNEESEGEG